jgi:predicted RNase H-like nuclease
MSGAVIGVDGCRFGWVAVGCTGRELSVTLAASWYDIDTRGAAVVAVDMPIGLSDSGRRGCDVAARRLLPGRRKSSVFPAPRRYMLGLDWAAANRLGKAREGVGLGRQSWHIGHKIAELDAAMSPAAQAQVREAHPELIFHRLNSWSPLPRKAEAKGRAARLRLLRAAGMPDAAPLLARYPRKHVKPDDILDAAACALAARDIERGCARRVPTDEPPRDGRDLRMEIWY